MSKPIALYVHIPFCLRKCNYCSFISYDYRQSDIPVYLNALKAELEQKAEGQIVTSIYFGGGTPSLLSAEQVGDILTTIKFLFDVDKAAEVSMEANPGTVDQAYLSSVRQSGINRLSLGVQSLKHTELKMLGRIHTSSEAKQAVQFARQTGFDNLNLDLIYGLPGQTLPEWKSNVEEVLALEPEHLSLYGLTLEEETPLWTMIEEHELPPIDPDLSADQYELAEDLLESKGYRHYEISNWAKPGFECRHNLVYWSNLPYMGVGVAAHSCLNGHRLANTGDLDKYLAAFAGKSAFEPEMDEEISHELEIAETVILGLRLDEGIDAADINKRYGVDVLSFYQNPIHEMSEAGLLENNGHNLRLTRHGRLMSNEVFWRLLPQETGSKTSN